MPAAKRAKRNMIIGAVLAIWGVAALISDLTGGQPIQGGAYDTGQTIGTVVAAILIVVGVRTVVVGLQHRQG